MVDTAAARGVSGSPDQDGPVRNARSGIRLAGGAFPPARR
jgi:hypothetical protein